MKKINKNFKSWLFIILVILLIVLAGFYLKGITGNVALANYLDTNYSAPYNLSNTSDYLFTISDNFLVAVDDIVNLSANVSMKGGYIYQKGYVFNQRTHSWEVFNFNQTPVENSYWIKDFASQDLVINVSNNVHNSSETYIVAYACKKDSSGAWQCGCQTESETGCKRWMLHTFNITNITISPDVNCTSDANCTITNGTCNLVSGLCESKAAISFPLGTPQNPFKIYNWIGLNNIRNNLTASYILMNNLDESSANYSDYAGQTANDGAGWAPLGNGSDGFDFNGIMNGNGFSITNLFINRPNENFIGLFGSMVIGANIYNLNVKDFNFTGRDYIGGLVGYSQEGVISNCSVTGIVDGSEDVGGLAGVTQSGTLSNSYSIGNVTGEYNVGGLVGWQWDESIILNSSSSVKVTGVVDYIGGLVGYSDNGVINNSYATGNVTGEWNIGGLVGQQDTGSISNSYATGKVNGISYVGGLAGYRYNGIIFNSYTTGTVACSGGSDGCSAGGLVGLQEEGTISNSHSTGNVTGSGDYVGGLAGYIYSCIISNSYATGNVTSSYDFVGGLVGYDSYGTISNSYATGNVTGEYEVGGFGYLNDGTIFSYFWYNRSNGINNCWVNNTGYYNINCTAKTTESYFKNYENAPMNLTAKTGWDFTNVWSSDGNGTAYPKLKWQTF